MKLLGWNFKIYYTKTVSNVLNWKALAKMVSAESKSRSEEKFMWLVFSSFSKIDSDFWSQDTSSFEMLNHFVKIDEFAVQPIFTVKIF